MASSTERPEGGDGETSAPLVDALEVAALVAIPALGLAAAVAFVGGEPLVGLIVGAVLGSALGVARRAIYAVRTPDGIERRVRRFEAAEDPNLLVRLANTEVDPRIELAIGLGCGLIAVGALLAIVLFVEDAATALRLGALAMFGMVCGLGALGTYALR